MRHAGAVVGALLVLLLGATAIDAWTRNAGGPVQAVVLAAQPEVLRALAGRDLRVSGTWLGGHVVGLQAASVRELHGVPGWIVRMPVGAAVAVPGCL
jgi:hypothetical protein